MEIQQLPVKASAVEAIKLPFLNLREFVKFGCVPIALTLPLQLLSLYIRSHVSNQPGIGGIFNLPRAIISVPFSVAWIRLGVNGARAVAHRGFYPFGRLERRFLLAEILLGFAVLVLGTVAALLIIGGFAKERQHLPVVARVAAVLLGAGTFVLVFIVAIRFSLAIAAVALQRYTGLGAAWQLGKGLTLRIIGIALLAVLPFYIAQGIFEAVQIYVAGSIWVLLPAFLFVVCEQLSIAASAGGLAIVYRFATSSQRSSTPVAAADQQAE